MATTERIFQPRAPLCSGASAADDAAQQVYRELDELPGLNGSPLWAEVFEVLHNHPIFPATTGDASRAALGYVHPCGHPQSGGSGRAALTVHLHATSAASVEAASAFAALQRHKLCCEWLGVPAGSQAAEAMGANAESRWLSLPHGDDGAHNHASCLLCRPLVRPVRCTSCLPHALLATYSARVRAGTCRSPSAGQLNAAAITELARACEATGAPAALPGALAAFADLAAAPSATAAFAQCAAALAVLAPMGSLVARVPDATSPVTASAAALCGRAFGRVSLFRPFAAPGARAGLYLVALHLERPSQMQLESLIALVDTLRAEDAPGGAFVAPNGVPPSLRASLAEAAAWAAERAAADVALATAVQAHAQHPVLASIGSRWMLHHGLDSTAPVEARAHSSLAPWQLGQRSVPLARGGPTSARESVRAGGGVA